MPRAFARGDWTACRPGRPPGGVSTMPRAFARDDDVLRVGQVQHLQFPTCHGLSPVAAHLPDIHREGMEISNMPQAFARGGVILNGIHAKFCRSCMTQQRRGCHAWRLLFFPSRQGFSYIATGPAVHVSVNVLPISTITHSVGWRSLIRRVWLAVVTSWRGTTTQNHLAGRGPTI